MKPMNSNKSWSEFLSKCPRSTDFLPSNYLLSRILKLGPGRDILIRGESGDGITSFVLELVKDLQTKDYHCIYCDLSNSLFDFRLEDLDHSKLAMMKIYSPTDILEAAFELRKSEEQFKKVFVFDSLHFLSQDSWNLKARPEELRDAIRRNDSESIIICTERYRQIRKPDFCWFEQVSITSSSEPTSMFNGRKIGRLVSFRGSQGEEDFFVLYAKGRFSKNYMKAKELIIKGEATPSSNFEGIKGIWNYVQSEI